ncbi:MAG: NADP-dependent malic enzyme, partial [Betaproteobacteria bacterium]|nr:NADP-dependent malic enzyme [Betaproteobacteria bacterium]
PYIHHVIGLAPGATVYAALNILMLPGHTLALVDTHINECPSASELAEIAIMASGQMRRMGLEPRVALVSHSNFGSSDAPSALKMREALGILRERAPDLNVDGEMHGDVALDPMLRKASMPSSTLTGEANLLVLPSMESANIAYNLLKTAAGNNVAVGPVLLGCAASVHIVTPAATVRRIVNMTAVAVLDVNRANKQRSA